MKRCPICNRTYTDPSLNFCLEDGAGLVAEAPVEDLQETIRYAPARETAGRPSSEPRTGPPPPGPGSPVPQWQPAPQGMPQKKSNAVWWILGGVFALGVVVVGLIVILVVLAAIGSQVNENANSSSNSSSNSNSSVVDSNSNVNANSNSASTRSGNVAVSDNFSDQKWGVGTFSFGEMWYVEGEYHMRSKKDTYLVMYAPSNDYRTENATVKVTARSVDGTSPSAGFGLIVHGKRTAGKDLEDYALLIFPRDDPAYQIVMHKDGSQVPLTALKPSRTIRSGTSPNQLEIRVKGASLSFYINGQYVDRVTDAANFRGGLAGFYSSDTTEVAFDDLEITR